MKTKSYSPKNCYECPFDACCTTNMLKSDCAFYPLIQDDSNSLFVRLKKTFKKFFK